MKHLLLLGLLVFAGINLLAQSTNCSVGQLSASDKAALLKFWNAFKQAINKKDKIALAKLCAFPLQSTFTKERDNNDVTITSTAFSNKHYRIFYHPLLFKLVNEKEITGIAFPVYDNTGKCWLQFSFGIEESATNRGWGRHIVIEKRNGNYKIVRLFNVP